MEIEKKVYLVEGGKLIYYFFPWEEVVEQMVDWGYWPDTRVSTLVRESEEIMDFFYIYRIARYPEEESSPMQLRVRDFERNWEGPGLSGLWNQGLPARRKTADEIYDVMWTMCSEDVPIREKLEQLIKLFLPEKGGTELHFYFKFIYSVSAEEAREIVEERLHFVCQLLAFVEEVIYHDQTSKGR